MKIVVADAKIGDFEFTQRTQPEHSIFKGIRPVSIRNDTHVQPGSSSSSCSFQQDGIEQKRFAAFKIDDLYSADLLDLLDCLPELFKREGSFLLRPAVQEAVVALARAFVGQ